MGRKVVHEFEAAITRYRRQEKKVVIVGFSFTKTPTMKSQS
ncbi:MAG: hypothetical protein ABSB40_04180 [Nitrososphaeria archaeon]